MLLYVCKIYFLSQNNIICINENLCPLVIITESVTAFVQIRSKKPALCDGGFKRMFMKR